MHAHHPARFGSKCSLSESRYKAVWSTRSGAHQMEVEAGNARWPLPPLWAAAWGLTSL